MELLTVSEMSLKQLSNELKLSPSIVTMHVSKLEQAQLIGSRRVRRNGGTHKLCFLLEQYIHITLPTVEQPLHSIEHVIPLGHYTDCHIQPTCGIGTWEKELGIWDDPSYFHHPERVEAAIIWFASGYVEYRVRNRLTSSQQVEKIEWIVEIASEAPGLRDTWLSDISFTLNHIPLGRWRSPADFGRAARGRYTPSWWHRNLNQYGLLKVITIDHMGTYIDGEWMSDVTLADLNVYEPYWTLRLAVEEDAEHVGGLTLYGAGFGNHDQDMLLRIYAKEVSDNV
ncbi:ArsR family transcriptional regulator [Paenibacillus sp. WLX2291]|uniref:ArsR family transcriptional regulator n=1 Tax=Paenibacillus sp. WLX2291 TaxID=3296934 RepID=UPI00398408BE